MIASLSGKISEKLHELVIVETAGVGYGVFVTAEDYSRMKTDEPIKLYIYEHIRENTHDLFGFLSLDTKRLFEQLLEVNGVGPKMVLSILSIGTTGEVRQAIAGGDIKFIQAANGVGKRLAERIVVELKDKVGLLGVDLSNSPLLQAEDVLMKDEAVEALVALGYTPRDAVEALHHVSKDLPPEDRIKQVLRGAA